MSTKHTPAEALESLVRDLNATYWSSWQSTAKFSDALRDAELVIERERVRDAAPEMLAALRRAALALAFAAETSPAMRDDYNAVSEAIAKATGEQA
jgi:hypothetical protein